jgi:hypothetical protein
MAQIPVSQLDAARLKTVLSALKRGKWELEGEEVLAFAQAFAWASDLSEAIKKALIEPASDSVKAPA